MSHSSPLAGQWRLIGPDGTVYPGASPIECLKLERDSRIPASVQLARILAVADEPDFAERHVQLGKFYSAKNVDDLIDKMEQHVLRLQAKLPINNERAHNPDPRQG